MSFDLGNNQRDVINHLRKKGIEKPSIRSISQELGIPYASLWRDIKQLNKQGIITVTSEARKQLCTINMEVLTFTSENAELIASRLNYKTPPDISETQSVSDVSRIPKYSQDPPGLITAVTRDWLLGDILMLAFMSKESLIKTLTAGKVCYWSRSRQQLWSKGETSGHIQMLKNILVDCDEDAIIIDVEQVGAACHTGERTCFYRNLAELLSV